MEATSPAGAAVTDAELGSATATDNVPGVIVSRSGIPAGNVFPLGTTVITYTATDTAGNTANATQRVVIRDTTPPVITIDAPDPVTFALHRAVPSGYACTDTVSAVTSSAGPVPNGSHFDTASVGSKAFAVSATDATGNTASHSVSYQVGYLVRLLYDPNRAANPRSTLPLRIQLADVKGNNVSSPAVAVTAIAVVKLSDSVSTGVEDGGNANPDGGNCCPI